MVYKEAKEKEKELPRVRIGRETTEKKAIESRRFKRERIYIRKERKQESLAPASSRNEGAERYIDLFRATEVSRFPPPQKILLSARSPHPFSAYCFLSFYHPYIYIYNIKSKVSKGRFVLPCLIS